MCKIDTFDLQISLYVCYLKCYVPGAISEHLCQVFFKIMQKTENAISACFDKIHFRLGYIQPKETDCKRRMQVREVI